VKSNFDHKANACDLSEVATRSTFPSPQSEMWQRIRYEWHDGNASAFSEHKVNRRNLVRHWGAPSELSENHPSPEFVALSCHRKAIN
jgi:hypothetical protein